jgi:hypothetical protein
VVETDPVTWVLVATERVSWADALRDGRLRASGIRTDLTEYLPLVDVPADEVDVPADEKRPRGED